jgi:hypothetical protein
VLLSYAWQQGSCFPGAERLQHDLGCGKNQVTRYLLELEDTDLICRRRRGQGKTTLYTLHDPPAAPTVTVPPQPSVADAPKQGAQTPRNGEQNKTQEDQTQQNFNIHYPRPGYRRGDHPRWRPPHQAARSPLAPLMMMLLCS